jgi:predicted RNA-binding protein with PIN domain
MVDQEWKLLVRAERVLVDGNNLVGGWDDVRLRAYESAIHRSIPRNATLEVFRDGGGRSADDRIIEAVGRPDLSRADRIVVVTDDRELRDRARRLGASTITARYFRDRIVGNTVAPTTTRATGGFGRGGAGRVEGKDEGPEERRWKPGRGATKKRGPSARPPRER